MKCDLCGSRKNVREFWAPMRRTFYKECRKCFELGFKMLSQCEWAQLTEEDMEREWASGKKGEKQ